MAALAATDAATGLNWVARVRTQRMLAALAVASGPVTHTQLDKLTPATAVTHLRVILVDAGVLSTRDERLLSLERTHRRCRPAERLRDRGQSLATCNQADIDDWLAKDSFSRSRRFVTWAVERGHASGIEIPRFKNEPVREVSAEHDERWTLVRQLLNGDTTAIADRVAGLLVLLYAQRAARITELTTKHVTITNDGVELLLADTPVALPPVLGDLVLNLLADRQTAVPTAPDFGVWLYPATRLGQPFAPRDLLGRLRTLGISPTLGRNTALMQMASEMPAAVIAKMLGISLDRATRWTHDAGNTRPGYAAELVRRRR